MLGLTRECRITMTHGGHSAGFRRPMQTRGAPVAVVAFLPHPDEACMDHRTREENVDDGLTARTNTAIREALEGRRRGLALLLPFAGPAIVVSVAYMDPGNFAPN